jgi:enterochelin esterase-like enzyme
MDPEDTAQGGALLGLWMAQGILPPMFIVYPDGRVVKKEQGSFFVNHFDTSGQDPYAYADAFIHEVIPLVESRYPVLSDPSEVERYPFPDTGCAEP